ncbi:MAG: cell division protein FtsX [Paludibacteraceae bacterium]
MSKSHRFWNMYLTAAMSVALVLCLVGLECVLLLSAGTLIHRMKENVTLTVILTDDMDSVAQSRFESMLSVADYCQSYRYISSEQALEEHIRLLGEDPKAFLGYNPLSASYEIHPSAVYADSDSIHALDSRLSSLPYVDKVLYQQDLVSVMNSNLSQVSVILLGLGVVLLLIAVVLIMNTIRLQIYSQRFLINTMTLVGATSWAIRSPFVARYIFMGTLAAVLAMVMVAGAVYYVNIHFGILLFPLTWQNIVFVTGVMLVTGILLTLVSSLAATGKYIRMSTDTMYEI